MSSEDDPQRALQAAIDAAGKPFVIIQLDALSF